MRWIHKEVPIEISREKQKLWNLAVCKWKWDEQQLVECKWLSAEEHEE
jgi:hypothetical protein